MADEKSRTEGCWGDEWIIGKFPDVTQRQAILDALPDDSDDDEDWKPMRETNSETNGKEDEELLSWSALHKACAEADAEWIRKKMVPCSNETGAAMLHRDNDNRISLHWLAIGYRNRAEKAKEEKEEKDKNIALTIDACRLLCSSYPSIYRAGLWAKDNHRMTPIDYAKKGQQRGGAIVDERLLTLLSWFDVRSISVDYVHRAFISLGRPDLAKRFSPERTTIESDGCVVEVNRNDNNTFCHNQSQ